MESSSGSGNGGGEFSNFEKARFLDDVAGINGRQFVDGRVMSDGSFNVGK